MSAPGLDGRKLLVVERDDLRAGRLVMALRGLGATAVRWTDDEKARAAAVDVVLVDREDADGWARSALVTIAAVPALAAAAVVRTDGARLWSGDEPLVDALVEAVGGVEARADRDTKNLRAVGSPSPVPPPKVEPAKVVVAPSIAARKIASARSTEKYGAVAAPDVQPPAVVAPAAPQEREPAPKKQGYVFPARKAGDLEDEASSKATSLDLTAVPSSILERANLPDTDRLERVRTRGSWVAWVVGILVVLSVLAVGLAFVMR